MADTARMLQELSDGKADNCRESVRSDSNLGDANIDYDNFDMKHKILYK